MRDTYLGWLLNEPSPRHLFRPRRRAEGPRQGAARRQHRLQRAGDPERAVPRADPGRRRLGSFPRGRAAREVQDPARRRPAAPLARGAARRPRCDPPGADQDPFLFSFLAHNEGKLAGSVGVRLDSTVRGLAADDMYRDELDDLRAGGQKLAELVQLSVDMNSVPRRVLAGLFHTAYLFAGTARGCDYCLLLANARYADFFYSSLGFDYVGDERVNARTATPMTLLAAHLPTVNEALARVGGRPGLATGDPTLFSHGFSPEEFTGVMKRLKSIPSGAPRARDPRKLDPGAVRRASRRQEIRHRDPVHHGAVVLQQLPHPAIVFRLQVHAEVGAELAPVQHDAVPNRRPHGVVLRRARRRYRRDRARLARARARLRRPWRRRSPYAAALTMPRRRRARCGRKRTTVR